MRLNKIAYQILPASLRRAMVKVRESHRLSRVARQKCDPRSLGENRFDLEKIFTEEAINACWEIAAAKTSALGIAEGAGGINPGDRRALFSLIHFLRPTEVLEVGTHIGASTLYIALAFETNNLEDGLDWQAQLTTIDICDVNDTSRRPWEKYGSPGSPRDLLKAVGADRYVQFITDRSIDFLRKTEEHYDFIFLDGDHRATTVYQEIPIALQRLRPGGFILLHDYFPDGLPLWPNGAVVPGPFLAVSRLREEGVAIAALPLGGLPWPTKLGSDKSSLALLYRTSR